MIVAPLLPLYSLNTGEVKASRSCHWKLNFRNCVHSVSQMCFNVHWSEPAAVCNEKYKILTESCWAGLIQPVMMVTRVWSLYLMICFTVKTRPHSQLSSVYSILVLNIEHKPCMMIISQTYWRWRLCFQQWSSGDARCKYFFWLLTSTLQHESHCSDHHQLCRHHSLLSV